MEEKKAPVATENFKFRAPDPEPVLLAELEPRKRPLSTCLLFLLLGLSVFSLGCFAVYAVISMGSSQINVNETGSKPLPLEQTQEAFRPNGRVNKVEPVFHFEIEVNGKKYSGTGDPRNRTEIVITHTDKPREFDEFSTIKNFIKKITGDNRPNIFNPTMESKISNEPNSKPKVISVESFEIRKIPSDLSVNFHPLDMFDSSPFEDVLDLFNPISPRFNKPLIPATQNKQNDKKEVPKNPKKENSNTKLLFPDFDDIFSDIFDDKPKSVPKNKTNSFPPKPFFPNVETFDPFMFPYGFSNKDKPEIINTKPREENNILKKKEKPYLDRYMDEKKPSDTDFLNSFLGLNTFMPRKVFEEPEVFFFNIPFSQPKYPKKYQSKSLSKDNEEMIKENKPNQLKTETPFPTTPAPTTPKSVQGEIMPSAVPSVTPTENTTPKKEILW